MSEMNAVQHTIDSLRREIDSIVTERQELRQAGAAPAELEANRERLVAAQARLSELLIARHRPRTAAA